MTLKQKKDALRSEWSDLSALSDIPRRNGTPQQRMYHFLIRRCKAMVQVAENVDLVDFYRAPDAVAFGDVIRLSWSDGRQEIAVVTIAGDGSVGWSGPMDTIARYSEGAGYA